MGCAGIAEPCLRKRDEPATVRARLCAAVSRLGVRVQVSAYDLAMRFVGLKEISGPVSNPQVLAMLRLDNSWVADDLVPWCGAFTSYIAWLLRLPRSKSLAARSWLGVGTPIRLEEARPGYDVVILRRGEGQQPGPETLDASGHVGFFAGIEGTISNQRVMLLGGNQGDQVSVLGFPVERILGVRRLYTESV